MPALHNPLRSNTTAIVFDVGGVLIDLHAEGARRELIEKYGFVSQSFERLTRSSFESHPRSITELAMIGSVGTSEYLDAFLHECGVKDLEALRLNRLSVVAIAGLCLFARGVVKHTKDLNAFVHRAALHRGSPLRAVVWSLC